MSRRVPESLLSTGLGAAVCAGWCAGLCAGLLGAGTAGAQAPEPAASPAASAPDIEVLESTRRWARSSSQWLARSVDSWFGDTPFEQGGKVTDGRMSVGLFRRQDRTPDFDFRFNARYRLPNVERHAYLFIGRDDPRNVIRDTTDAVRAQQLLPDRPQDRSVLAGLGVMVLKAVDFRVGVGAGLRPYAQARYEHPWTVAPGHFVHLRETAFWSSADKFGSTTALSYDVALSETLAIRWFNSATITQTSRNVGWASSLAAVQSFGEQRRLSLEAVAGGTGTTGTGVGASDLGLLARWEQPVYASWLFAEFVGGHFWPRRDATSERSRAWAAGASLKMQF